MDCVGKHVNGISVVERLSAKMHVKVCTTLKRAAIVNVLIRLDNPDKLLARVVEIELDFVGRGTHRLIASELKLLNQVLMRVLCHATALIGVKEDVVNVERGSNKGLVVGGSDLDRLANIVGVRARGARAVQIVHCPEALINGAEVEVNLDLVVLKSNKRKCKTGVAAVPELKRYVKSSLWERVARSANLADCISVTGTINRGERWVCDVSKLSGVTNHLFVATLLLGREGKLIPDVHPVTILAIDALPTNLNLNL
tara:strand:+ start:129 stop:896 length:768 start_codon:yes stop_codon:yes gene_type:complete